MASRRGGVFVRAALCGAALAALASAQYVHPARQFWELYGERVAALDTQLKHHPDLEAIYFPLRYHEPIDFYRCVHAGRGPAPALGPRPGARCPPPVSSRSTSQGQGAARRRGQGGVLQQRHL
jgi:hypothetical protein